MAAASGPTSGTASDPWESSEPVEANESFAPSVAGILPAVGATPDEANASLVAVSAAAIGPWESAAPDPAKEPFPVSVAAKDPAAPPPPELTTR